MRRVRPSEPGRAADAARAGSVGCARTRTRDGSVRAQRRLAGGTQNGRGVQGGRAVPRRAAHRDGGDQPGHDQYHAAARRPADDVLVAEAEIVFVCIDRVGRATPIPEEIVRFLGPRPTGGHAPIRVPAGDVELGVEVRGEGVPVLFVHGFPFDRTVWRHQLAMLSRVKRIAPDLRGVGASGAPASDGYTLVRYADDLVAVLDALGIRAAVLCGLSMGGYVIFELLRRHAERVRAIILADTKAEPDSAEGKRGRDELAALAERQGQDAVIDRLLPRLLAPATLGTQPEVVAQVR